MDTSILEDLGLTGAEIKVFISLLELGSSNAGAVVKKSGLQNAVVHRGFHSLIQKGLMTFVLKGKIKEYKCVEPRALLNFLDEKKARLEKILPELEAKRNLLKNKPRATIFEGIRGVKEARNLMLETNSKEYFAYGGEQKGQDLLGDVFWETFHKKRIGKKIKAKLIFHESLKFWGDELNKYSLTEVKVTVRDFEEKTDTVVCGDRVSITIFSSNPFTFLIEDESVARSYRRFFDLLWNVQE
jgi:HTH-type transcriptional regulator, sugar sensing transcriptional regulator